MPLAFDHTDDSLDALRHDFLVDLDDAAFDLTDWEAQFLDSNLHNTRFSPAQRTAIDRMRDKYQNKL